MQDWCWLWLAIYHAGGHDENKGHYMVNLLSEDLLAWFSFCFSLHLCSFLSLFWESQISLMQSLLLLSSIPRRMDRRLPLKQTFLEWWWCPYLHVVFEYINPLFLWHYYDKSESVLLLLFGGPCINMHNKCTLQRDWLLVAACNPQMWWG